MAVAFVQAKASTEGSSVTSLATTFDSSTTSGNLIHVQTAVYDTDATPPTNFSVTDSKSNTYSNTGAPAVTFSTEARIEAKYAANITGGASHQVTVSPGDTVYMTVGLIELSGAATSSPADGQNSNSGTGTAVSSGNVTPTTNGMFVAGMSYDGSSTTIAVNWTSGTQRLEIDENNDACAQNIATKAATASTLDNAGWTLGTSTPWAATIIAYKEAGAAGTTVSPGSTTHTYTAQTPKVSAKVQPAQVTHTYTARTPQVKAQVKPAQVTHSYTGQTPQAQAKVQPSAVTHTYTAQVPGVTAGVTVTATVAQHAYTVTAPQVQAKVQPGAVTHTYVGQTPSILTGNAVAVTVATHSYAAAVPQVQAKVQPAQVTHTYTAQAPQARASVMPGAATHTYAGVAPAVLANLEIAVPAVAHIYGALLPTVSDGTEAQAAEQPSGGWRRRRRRHWYERLPTAEEIQEERERLGILPKKAQKAIRAVVSSAIDVETQQQAATLVSAYLEEQQQRKLMDRLRKEAADKQAKWRDEMFAIAHALILDALRKKADQEMLAQLLAEQEAEYREINDILSLWMQM